MRCWKYDVNKLSVVGSKVDWCFSLYSSFWCDMVSYAFVRSMNTARVCFLSDFDLMMSSMMAVRAAVVSDWGRNAYWCLSNMLCCSKCCMSCSLISVSKILPMMGKSEMGL